MQAFTNRNAPSGRAIASVLLIGAWFSGGLAVAQHNQGAGAKESDRATAAGATAAAAPHLIGVLNAESWETAKGLIPDEFLNRYKSGEWSSEIWEPPPNTIIPDPDFVEAGKRNAGRYEIGPEGQVLEVATGTQPRFIYGPPFPDIDPDDPAAGAKCVWNFFYQSYTLGNSLNFITLDFVGPKGVERRLATEVHQRYFDGQPPKYRPQSNSQNFLFQSISGVTWPADLEGTVALAHRFRDPRKRDQQWTYVPALRRVRAVSPANRSDGFLGSDMSQDDGSYFDGKPEDFVWRLAGEGEQLVPYDRAAVLEKKHGIRPLATGGTEFRDDTRPRLAYQVPGWSGEGLAWRPLRSAMILVKRPVWIVEGRPKDPYYLYGKIVLRFDKPSWRGTYNSKYDWKGETLNSYMPNYGPHFSIDGEWRWYSSKLFTMAQNWKANRATVSYPTPQTPTYQYRIPYSDDFFTVDKLTHRGK